MLTAIDSAGDGFFTPGYDVYMGYVDRTTGGHTASFAAAVVAATACGGRALSITTDANWAADIFDTESGAEPLATNVAWQAKKTTPRPIHYIGVLGVNTLVELLAGASYARPAYRILSAHYTPARGAHICGPATCGPTTGIRFTCDGTQYAGTAGGKDTYDLSVLTDLFFDTVVPPEEVMPYGIVEYEKELWSVFAATGQVKKCHLSATQVTALSALGAERLTKAPWNNATLLAELPVVASAAAQGVSGA